MRRTLFAVGGLLAGTTMLVAVKTPPDAFQSVQAQTGAAGNQVAPAPDASGSPPAANDREGTEDREDSGGSGSDQNAAETFLVTGPSVSNDYGAVQVRITMAGDRLQGVEALEMPTSSARSEQLSARVERDLAAEAVRQQSADLDAVSGASATSASYLQSLQGALDAAAQGERD